MRRRRRDLARADSGGAEVSRSFKLPLRLLLKAEGGDVYVETAPTGRAYVCLEPHDECFEHYGDENNLLVRGGAEGLRRLARLANRAAEKLEVGG